MRRTLKQTTERRVSASLRVALAAVLLLLNIGAVVLLTIFLQAHAAIIFGVMEAVAIAVAISIQSSPASASYKLAWTLLVVAVPVAGLILYVLWGGNIQKKGLDLLPVRAPALRARERERSAEDIRQLEKALPAWSRTASMLARRGFLLYRDTQAVYFPTGRDFFHDALERMAEAERFIFLEYFILAEGALWERIFAVLEDRARHGVEVCVLFDDFGNMTRMGNETLERMREAGISLRIFNPVHRYVNRLYFNYRDHRKILCVDGQYAYTGGVNVADEYVGIVRRFGEWKDSGVRLDGPGAWGLTARFIHMWEMMGSRLREEHDFYRPWGLGDADDGDCHGTSSSGRSDARRSRASGWCQPFSDGPANNPDNPAEDVFLQCVANARRYIWLTTPYFAVEDSMVRALCLAAESGVDVRLLLPGIPDHRYTQIVAGSYYGRLLAHGVKIYEFKPGFLHAKSFLADGETGFVGTVNMDYRSFQLHYECGVMLYGVPALRDLRADMEGIMAVSGQVDPERWEKRGWLRKVLEKVLRVFSIWM